MRPSRLADGAPAPPGRSHRHRAGIAHPVVVFNSLSHARTELITVEAPDRLTAAVGRCRGGRPVQRDDRGPGRVRGHRARLRVPGLRPDRRHIRRTDRRSHRRVRRHLENDHLRVELDDQGLLSLDLRQVRRPPGARPRGPGQPLPAPPRLSQLLRRLGHRPVHLRPGGRPRRGRVDRVVEQRPAAGRHPGRPPIRGLAS